MWAGTRIAIVRPMINGCTMEFSLGLIRGFGIAISRQFFAFFIILAFSIPVYATTPLKACRTAYLGKDLPPYAIGGAFSHSPEREEEVRKELLHRMERTEDRALGLITNARRVEERDLIMDFSKATSQLLETIHREGLAAIRRLAIITSGAGLWSRGGGQVKAEVPYNLSDVLPTESLARLTHLGKIVKAATTKEVIELSGKARKSGESLDAAATRIRKETEAEIDQIIRQAKISPYTLNAIDMKFVMAAILSQRSGSYLILDIWTSQKTHGQVASYLDWFEANFTQKTFHLDSSVDAYIKGALKDYIAKSHELGETHLFGYQVGIRAFRGHSEEGKFGETVHDSEPIGEGAGMLKSYLDKSGRTAQLQRQGRTHFIFENIEVQNDWALIFGAHLRANRPTSIVLVPQRPGYSGGNGFVVRKDDGTDNIELHETAVMSRELREGHAYFNTNTIVQALDSPAPTNLDFEVRDNGRIQRAKVNAGDVTKVTPTAAIGGRIGIEYENFKSFEDYVKLGSDFLRNFRNLWATYAHGG